MPHGLTIDVDSTLVDVHSDKEAAAPTYKRGYGMHPIGAWCDDTAEPLAALLRPGNAGANSAVDHIDVLGLAIDALPAAYQVGHQPGDDPATVPARRHAAVQRCTVASPSPNPAATSTWGAAPVVTSCTAAARRPTTSPASQHDTATPHTDTAPPSPFSIRSAASDTRTEPAGRSGNG